jgi:polyphosphate kinase
VSQTADATPDTVERDLYDPYLYINREISWLQFNDRVLAMAADPEIPLLERLKYLSIFATNLDEFFMVRVAGLRDQVESGIVTRGSDGWTPSETLEAIAKHVGPSIEYQVRVFLDEVVPAMAEAGIRIADMAELDDRDLDFLRDYFQRQVFPVLTPLAVDPSHPFPYISNLSLSLAVTVRDPGTARDRFARVKVPGILPRFVPLGDGSTFVPLEQVVATHLDKLFPGMDVVEAHPFRVTRDADIELAEDEADDLLVAVEQELRRQRFGRVVRLEVAETMPDHVVRLLQRELEVEDDALVMVEGPLNLGDLMGLVSSLDRPELAEEPWVGTTQPRLLATEEDSVNLFATLREGDLLVHHPYDAFSTSVQRFIDSKTALVVRREHGGIRRYVHIGTGNYNAKTARLYTDLGLLSCDEDLGADLTELFNSLTGYARGGRYRKILVAPNFLRQGVIELVERTAERHSTRRPGRITLQMNALVDAACIRALYAASQAGVEIDLIVRGICRLRPGVPGVSENIRVRSIVGRFLEHGRIWNFANGRRREYYIGSADLMPRNLDLRVECVTPVTDPDLTGRLQEVLDVMLADNVQAWELSEDGSWHRTQPAEGERRVATHKRLRELALRRGVEARSGTKHEHR